MSATLAETLAASPYLAPLAQEIADAWAAGAARREFAAREVLFAPEDPATAVFALADGRVKLTAVSDQGKELIIALLGPGDVFGELPPSEADRHRTFAEAVEAGVAWSVPQAAVRALLDHDPAVAYAFMRLHGARRLALERRLADLTFKDVPQRLAAALLEFVQRDSDDVRLTHYDLAGLIGSTRETTTLFLNKFREAGWAELDKRRVHLTDRAALAEVVAGTRSVEEAAG